MEIVIVLGILALGSLVAIIVIYANHKSLGGKG